MELQATSSSSTWDSAAAFGRNSCPSSLKQSSSFASGWWTTSSCCFDLLVVARDFRDFLEVRTDSGCLFRFGMPALFGVSWWPRGFWATVSNHPRKRRRLRARPRIKNSMLRRPTCLTLLPARRAGRARFCEAVRPRFVLRALGAPLRSLARPCIRRHPGEGLLQCDLSGPSRGPQF